MNEERFNNEVEQRWGGRPRQRDNGHKWAGAVLLIVGGLLLARESGVYFPQWFFTWPMILIAIGLFTGIRHGFRNAAPFIFLLLGGIFLADKISADFSLKEYVWPIVIMAAGLYFIFRPRSHNRCGSRYGRYARHNDQGAGQETIKSHEDTSKWEQAMADRNDVVDVTAIFGGVKKNMLSKNFKGGEVVAFMGGTEIDLTQADFNGRVIIDNFNMFGGTKLIVPPDWDVQSQIVAVFGGVDDKRPPAVKVDPNKILFLDGTCIFGGVEIKSY